MVTDMKQRIVHFPAEWIPMIDEVRGEIPFSEFVREAVREKVGKRKLKATRKRGRPRKEE